MGIEVFPAQGHAGFVYSFYLDTVCVSSKVIVLTKEYLSIIIVIIPSTNINIMYESFRRNRNLILIND